VSQQPLVSLDLGKHFWKRQLDRTSPAGCRKDLLHQPSRECPQVQRRRLEFHLARIETSDEEHFFHYLSHAAPAA